jgi:transglutaminase-like putative cysteine protease
MYLRPSRYAEADKFYGFAATEFGNDGDSANLLEHVSSWVGTRLNYVPGSSDPIDGAVDTLLAGEGVCRDYAHLAIAFCRCMNIPARYCTGYLGDIGVPRSSAPMDFAAWFEAYIDGRWYTFDPRNNMPRIGRVLIGRGRDATDVPISNTFGPNTLAAFNVWADEVDEGTCAV